MPQQKLLLQPGINNVATQTLAEGTWSYSNLIRWKEGYLEKIGGWSKYSETPCIGTVRGMHAWMDLNFNVYLAVGSEQRLQLFTQGSVYDITPITKTENIGGAFSTIAGLTEVTVTNTSHGANVGDWINIVCPVSVGGIIIFGYYIVTSVIDGSNYTIESSSPAIYTVSNGGNTPLFESTNGSSTVDVTLENHGLSPGESFTVEISTSVGGLTIYGTYLVEEVQSLDSFTITSVSGATSDDSAYENGNNARIQYLLASGTASDVPLLGWGSGAWGEGEWGISENSGSAVLPLRNWFLDNFGEFLIAQYTNGPIYVWQPPVGLDNVATNISSAPQINTASFVAMPQAQVIALGAEILGSQDPLLIRWSDAGDYTNWTASAENQAGSFRLSRGSRIIGGLQAPQNALIWTDTDVWSMRYVSTPFVYGFDAIGTGCGLIAPKAAACLGRNTYWMSSRGFFSFGDSGVQPIICPVWDKIFSEIDVNNITKCFAAANSPFHEVGFFYPSTNGNGEIDSYVKLNTVTQSWDYGSLVRTAWIDESIIGLPVGIDGEKYIQQHEISDDADGSAMLDVFAETGYIDIADGTEYTFVDMIIPDFRWRGQSTSVQMTLYSTDFPGSNVDSHGPYIITPETPFISVRLRARQVALKIESDSLGWWRLGAIRVRTSSSGRQ